MLVIFDCDGVLVDSEPIANRVLTALIQECGWNIAEEETIARFVGRSLAYCVDQVRATIPDTFPEDFSEQYHSRINTAFEAELQATPGVREVIEGLTVPFCVASSSGHSKLRMTLGVTGLLPLFEGRIYSSEDVLRGKPAPDLFLYAASQMGAKPEECTVIEDSMPGVQAGLAAGMRVLAYRGFADPSEIGALGVTVYDCMDQIQKALG